MGKGKRGAGGGRDAKVARTAAEAMVNEAVKTQDLVDGLPPNEAQVALQTAASKYRGALEIVPGHTEAAYNLATCLSELADLTPSAEAKVSLMREAKALLTKVIERDTSGRGATTALAHHTVGNVLREMVEVYREHCPSPCPTCAVGCPSASECMQKLHQVCRHFEAAVSIETRLQNPTGHVDEVLVHWGDTYASIMQLIVESAPNSKDGQPLPERPVQEAFAMCSKASEKYSEALASDTSSGGSDVDTLRLKAGLVVDLLDWALPDTSPPIPSGVGLPLDALLDTADQAVATLLGLDGNHVAGLLAKGDLCRLRARVAMLSGASLQEEGVWREQSAQWLGRAIALAPQDADALSTAGEASLEYGRRSLHVTSDVVAALQGGRASTLNAGLNIEALRVSALARLQDARSLLSRAMAIDSASAALAYNAACAFCLSGDFHACGQALTEFTRRLVRENASRGSRDAARVSLQEAVGDQDLAGVRETEWFAALVREADANLRGNTRAP